jgi:transcriptional regulator with XRE-family HTH domain
MKSKKITQKALCAYIGAPETAVCEWKAGRNSSYTKYLPQIAEFLDVPIDYLLGKETQGDTELSEYLEHLRTRSEMRMLFSLTKDATKEEVERAVKVIEAMLKG